MKISRVDHHLLLRYSVSITARHIQWMWRCTAASNYTFPHLRIVIKSLKTYIRILGYLPYRNRLMVTLFPWISVAKWLKVKYIVFNYFQIIKNIGMKCNMAFYFAQNILLSQHKSKSTRNTVCHRWAIAT